MAQYIDKSDLVAEIERRIEHNTEWKDACKTLAVLAANQAIEEDKKILSIIDTFKVKEVDLEKYYHDFLQKEWFGNSHARTVSEMMAFTARHFFELALSLKNS